MSMKMTYEEFMEEGKLTSDNRCCVHSTFYSTIYIVHCTLYTVHCTQCCVHSTLYTVKCTQYIVHRIMYTVYL